MRKGFIFAAIAAFSLTLPSCTGDSGDTGIGSASTVCAHSKADEQAVVGVGLAYKAFRLSAETGVEAGIIKGERARVVADADNRAFAAVEAVDVVYRTCNGNLAEALARANSALSVAVRSTSDNPIREQ